MKPVRTFKYITVILVSLLILAGGSSALFVYLYPREKLLKIITSSIENATDRKVSISNIEYGFSGIIINDFKIYNDITGEKGFIASARNAHIRFSLLSLLDKKFTINHISLNDGKMNIIYSDGTSNIEELIRHIADTTDDEKDEKSSISSSISTIALNNTEVLLKDAPDSLSPLNGSYNCDAIISFPKTQKVKLSDVHITLPEGRGNIETNMLLSIGKGNFSAEGDVTLKKCSLLWVYKWTKTKNSIPFKTFTGTIRKLSISANRIEGFVKGTSILSDSRRVKVDGLARVNLNGKTVFVSNVDGSINSSSFKLNELLFNFDGDLKKLHVTEADVAIADVFSVIPGVSLPLSGSLKGNLKYSDKIINADIFLSNAGYTGKKNILSGITTHIVIENNQFKKQEIPVSLLGQPATLSVATMDKNFNRFVLNVNLDTFSIDNIPGDDKEPIGSLQLKLPVELSGKIQCGILKIDNLKVQNIQLNYRFAGSKLSLYSFQSTFAEGNIKGRGTISFAKKSPYFDIDSRFTNIKVQELARIDPRFDNRLYGIAEGNINLEFGYDSNVPFLNALEGKLEFTIDKGKLVNTGIQDGLGIWLSELKYKLKDLEFSKIYGNFNIMGPNYYIRSFIFNAPDIRLKVDGFFNKVAESNIKIDLEFTPDFIKDLPNPALLQLSQYKQGRWYVIPFEAKGKDISKGKNIKRLR